MLLGMNSLRDFVPAKVVPGWLLTTGMSGRRGVADFVNGQVVPGYLLSTGMSALTPSSPTGMTIPNNSVMTAWQGAGMSGCDDGCGCGGKCGGGGGCGSGMGQLSLSSITAPFSQAWTDIQAAISAGSITPLTGEDWLVIAGTAAAAWWLMKKGRR
jgi:hypothetical protein